MEQLRGGSSNVEGGSGAGTGHQQVRLSMCALFSVMLAAAAACGSGLGYRHTHHDASSSM
jgi:hypothetical protein